MRTMTYTEKNHVKTEGENRHLQAKEGEALGETSAADILISDFQLSEI